MLEGYGVAWCGLARAEHLSWVGRNTSYGCLLSLSLSVDCQMTRRETKDGREVTRLYPDARLRAFEREQGSRRALCVLVGDERIQGANPMNNLE